MEVHSLLVSNLTCRVLQGDRDQTLDSAILACQRTDQRVGPNSGFVVPSRVVAEAALVVPAFLSFGEFRRPNSPAGEETNSLFSANWGIMSAKI